MQERLSEKEVVEIIDLLLKRQCSVAKAKQALIQMKETYEVMEKAEVPEKKNISSMSEYGKKCYNQAIDACKPILAQKQLEIDELNQRVAELEEELEQERYNYEMKIQELEEALEKEKNRPNYIPAGSDPKPC